MSEQQNQEQTNTVSETQTTTSAQPEQQPKKLEGEELKSAIRKQVEFYLSRQNLSNDAYLVSFMNKDMFVPLEIIAGFKMIKNHTDSIELIIESLQESKSVSLDESRTKVRPNFNVTRNTVIIRDIPSSTTPEEVKKLFASDNQPKELKSDIGDMWYATFETEQAALGSLDHLRLQTFNNKPVSSRIKSENLLKSIYPVEAAQFPAGTIPTNSQGIPHSYPVYHGRYSNRGAPYNNYEYQQQYDPYARGGYNQRRTTGGYRGGRGGRGGRPTTYPVGGQYQKRARDTQTQSSPEEQQQQQPQQPQQAVPQQPAAQQQDISARGKPYPYPAAGKPKETRPRRGSKRDGSKSLPPNLTNESFPPLPTIPKTEASGYHGEFLKYPKSKIIEIFAEKSGSLPKPNDLPENCTAVTSTAVAELELTKPLPESLSEKAPAPEKKVEESPTTIAPKQEAPMKSFAEVAITAKDIKTPEIRTVSNETSTQARKEANKKRSGSFGKQPQQQTEKPRSRKGSKAGSNANHVSATNSKEASSSNPQSQQPKKGGKPQRKKVYVEASNESKEATATEVESKENTYAAAVLKAKNSSPKTPAPAVEQPKETKTVTETTTA